MVISSLGPEKWAKNFADKKIKKFQKTQFFNHPGRADGIKKEDLLFYSTALGDDSRICLDLQLPWDLSDATYLKDVINHYLTFEEPSKLIRSIKMCRSFFNHINTFIL